MRITNFKAILVTLSLSLAGLPAFAAESPFYIGASYGLTRSDVKTSQVASYVNACAGISCSKDGNDSGFSLFGGYSFNHNLAIEAAFVDLGDTASIDSSGGSGTSATRQSTDGIRIALVGSYPVADRFTLLGKIGFYRWTSDTSFSNSSGLSVSASESGTKSSFGLGVSYTHNKNVSLELTWDRYTSLGTSSGALQSATGPAKTIELDADRFAFGVRYRF